MFGIRNEANVVVALTGGGWYVLLYVVKKDGKILLAMKQVLLE
jgi:hypothetical protein